MGGEIRKKSGRLEMDLDVRQTPSMARLHQPLGCDQSLSYCKLGQVDVAFASSRQWLYQGAGYSCQAE